jgi:hypothetical protein
VASRDLERFRERDFEFFGDSKLHIYYTGCISIHPSSIHTCIYTHPSIHPSIHMTYSVTTTQTTHQITLINKPNKKNTPNKPNMRYINEPIHSIGFPSFFLLLLPLKKKFQTRAKSRERFRERDFEF